MAHFLLAKAYLDAGEPVRGREELEQAARADPTFLPARMALVRQWAAENKMREARAQLNDLAKDFPGFRAVLELQGWLASEEGDAKKALVANRTLFQKFPGESPAVQLAQSEWKSGEPKQALSTLDAWILQHPEAADARMKAAEIHLALGQADQAIRQIQDILKTQPRHVLALNNLAWLYRGSNPAKALELATTAVTVAPNSADALDTLGMIELDRGEAGSALKALRRATELAPENLTTRFHVALALDKSNQRDEAIQLLTGLAASPRAFPEQDEARALLDRETRP